MLARRRPIVRCDRPCWSPNIARLFFRAVREGTRQVLMLRLPVAPLKACVSYVSTSTSQSKLLQPQTPGAALEGSPGHPLQQSGVPSPSPSESSVVSILPACRSRKRALKEDGALRAARPRSLRSPTADKSHAAGQSDRSCGQDAIDSYMCWPQNRTCENFEFSRLYSATVL